jgi:hypothetical protein
MIVPSAANIPEAVGAKAAQWTTSVAEVHTGSPVMRRMLKFTSHRRQTELVKSRFPKRFRPIDREPGPRVL